MIPVPTSTGQAAGAVYRDEHPRPDTTLEKLATLKAVFVADGTVGHVFAETLAEHNTNVQKWYAIRRARGEM